MGSAGARQRARWRVRLAVTALAPVVVGAMPTTGGDGGVAAPSGHHGGEATPAEDATAGRAALATGDFGAAARELAASADRHRRAGHPRREATELALLARAQRGLGDYHAAERTLRLALRSSATRADDTLRAGLLADLGDVQIATAPSEAEATLRQADALARASELTGLRAVIANNLGNLYRFAGDLDRALAAYTRGSGLAAEAQRPVLEARNLANAARAAADLKRPTLAVASTRRAAVLALDLPASHEQAVQLVNVARIYSRLSPALPGEDPPLVLRAFGLLRRADDVAGRIGDVRTRSYALGYIGALYGGQGRYEDADAYTSRALFLADQVDAPDLQYRWLAQHGRLARDAGKPRIALSSLRRAATLLDSLRPQLQGGYGSERVNFRDGPGRLYSELAGLLLLEARREVDPARGNALLLEARDTMERLKRAELRDYFRDECVDALESRTTGVEQASLTAAVIYPMSLPDRLEILLTLPGGVMKSYVQEVPGDRFTEEVHRFRALLTNRTTRGYLRSAQQLYAWLLGPVEADVEAASVDTLVFVPDGALLSVPMAALHDGSRFLVERYPVAITPSLRLTDPRPLDRAHLRPLLAGVSHAVDDQPPLPYVPDELRGVQEVYGGTVLLDEDFKLDELDAALRRAPYNVVHIATHGLFDERAEDSYLYLSDGRMSMDRLERAVDVFRYRDTPLELLTLSACETAKGTERAALGLAGMAVKAGARSVVGTLWKVQDASASALVIDFYSELARPGTSRAVALATAQRELLADRKFAHPFHWAGFVLVGNWL
jgi:CHAT domain-containing protein